MMVSLNVVFSNKLKYINNTINKGGVNSQLINFSSDLGQRSGMGNVKVPCPTPYATTNIFRPLYGFLLVKISHNTTPKLNYPITIKEVTFNLRVLPPNITLSREF